MNKEYNYYRIPAGIKIEKVQATDEDGFVGKLQEVNIDEIIEQSQKELSEKIIKEFEESSQNVSEHTGRWVPLYKAINIITYNNKSNGL